MEVDRPHCRSRQAKRRATITIRLAWVLLVLIAAQSNAAQNPSRPTSTAAADRSAPPQDSAAESDLRQGIDLARQGRFSEALPRLGSARGRVADEYAAGFNLALCYVGLRQFRPAIEILNSLRASGRADLNVENLLAQAYIGGSQPDRGFEALQRAAKLGPKNEKLYLFVGDAAAEGHDYGLGLRVVELGLRQLPESARLHYQRGYFLSLLDRFDVAKADFDLAMSLSPDTEIAFVAAAQKGIFAGDLPAAIQAGRAAASKGCDNYLTQTIIGEALMRSGAAPGQPEFAEAASALQKAVASHPNYASAQIALGSLLLIDGHVDPAIEHLETARQLDPTSTAVHAQLARAYRRAGKPRQADQALALLAKLNEQEAERIKSAPGDSKSIPGAYGRSVP